jgi:hypothetical protein
MNDVLPFGMERCSHHHHEKKETLVTHQIEYLIVAKVQKCYHVKNLKIKVRQMIRCISDWDNTLFYNSMSLRICFLKFFQHFMPEIIYPAQRLRSGINDGLEGGFSINSPLTHYL